ncbi:hypothetical protein PtB15_8B250 [Puccinia triticina]|nr:hypothetical protein PtB15_8B250 [Puccinia triticina]
MMDRLSGTMSFIPSSDSLCFSWFICVAIFGLAYYTNPSENPFKRFLDQLPIPKQHKSLRCQPIDNSFNQQNPTCPLGTKSNNQQCNPKQNTGQRNPKGPASRMVLASASKLSFSIQTSHYNRHNFLLYTLISIDHSQHSVYNISSNRSAGEGYPQLEWFLGCFNTWFPLQRQISIALDSFLIVSNIQSLKSFWNQRALSIPGVALFPPPLTDELISSPQDLSPLLTGRKKNPHRIPKLTSLSQTSAQSNHFPECSPSEDSFSTSSGSEHDCYTTLVSAPTSPCTSHQVPATSGPHVESSPGDIKLNARSPNHITATNEILVSLTLNTSLIPEHSARSISPACTNFLESSETNSTSNNHLLRETSQCDSSIPSPEGFHQQAEKDLKPPSHDLKNQLKELDYKCSQEDLNKVHYQSSLKHLSEIKDLKEFKQRNLDEKLKQCKATHDKLAKQSSKVQEDIVAIQTKVTSIRSKFTKDTQQIKKEGERLKTAIKHTKFEIDQLSKTNEMKTAKKKELKEKLATRQTELNHKRESNKRDNPENKSEQTTAPHRHLTTQDSAGQSSVADCPRSSQCSTSLPTLLNQVENLPLKTSNISAINTSSSIWPKSQDSFTFPPSENSMGPMLFPDFAHSSRHLDGAWAPDPLSETIQQSNIRETFISLPNLELSALKDRHPILQALDTSLSLPPLPASRLTDELFNYRHEIPPPAIALISEWTRPLSSQASLPFGAIGQDSPTRVRANTSPVVHASSFCFPDTLAPTTPLICSGLLAGKKRYDTFSRTSSSSSLSQMPGYGSVESSPASPYAPVGTPAYLSHQRLNELQETSGEAIEDYTFGGSPHDPSEMEADFCQALSLKMSSRRLKTSNSPTVGLTGREKDERIMPTETIPKESPSGFKKHQSTQSLGGNTPPEDSGLNSIFDVVPEPAWPSRPGSQRPSARPALNPSAKVFTFSAFRPSSVTRPCPTLSVGQQRARGYSYSTITSSSPIAMKPSGLKTKAEPAEQAKLRKSLHRSSWSVVVGMKAAAAGPPRNAGKTREASSSSLNGQDGSNGSLSSENTLTSKSPGAQKLTGSPSELASTSSPGHALPAEFTKAACAGLFGPIGDSKPKKSPSTQSSPSLAPLATSLSVSLSHLTPTATAGMAPES